MPASGHVRGRRFESTRVGDGPSGGRRSNAASSIDGLDGGRRARSCEQGWSSGSGTRCLSSPKRSEVRGARLPAAGRGPFPRPVGPFSVLSPGRLGLHGPSWSASLELASQWGRTLLTFALLEDSVGTSTARRSEEHPGRRAAAGLRSEDVHAACGRSALQRGSARNRAPGGAASGQVSRSRRSGHEPDTRSGWRCSCWGATVAVSGRSL
jgi:hypothetical protein